MPKIVWDKPQATKVKWDKLKKKSKVVWDKPKKKKDIVSSLTAPLTETAKSVGKTIEEKYDPELTLPQNIVYPAARALGVENEFKLGSAVMETAAQKIEDKGVPFVSPENPMKWFPTNMAAELGRFYKPEARDRPTVLGSGVVSPIRNTGVIGFGVIVRPHPP